tara:strand:+ start:2325 stop:2663 length:339 start_codon:yes stop_codon:yes gene_type:complete
MTAANHNLTIDQGSDFVIDLVIKDEGVVKNLTGYSARAQMRITKSASTIAATFTCTVTDASEGQVKMELPNATSSALSPGKYYYDLELFTASDAIVARLMQGTVILTPEVTR